jgi:hypothetical protein
MEPLNVSVLRGSQDLEVQNRIVKAGPFAKTLPGGPVSRRTQGCGSDGGV